MNNNAEEIRLEKNTIRKAISVLKNNLPSIQKNEYADQIFSKIESLAQFQKAKAILFYWSTIDELPTHHFVQKWSATKKILLPTIKNNILVIKEFTSINELQQGDFGIWEPNKNEKYVGNIDIVLVPGVAFDRRKNRLGRGKGFYDRFLKTTNAEKWGVGYDCQLLDFIPTDDFDVSLDKILTTNNLIE